eukprot:gene17596-27089_t
MPIDKGRPGTSESLVASRGRLEAAEAAKADTVSSENHGGAGRASPARRAQKKRAGPAVNSTRPGTPPLAAYDDGARADHASPRKRRPLVAQHETEEVESVDISPSGKHAGARAAHHVPSTSLGTPKLLSGSSLVPEEEGVSSTSVGTPKQRAASGVIGAGEAGEYVEVTLSSSSAQHAGCGGVYRASPARARAWVLQNGAFTLARCCAGPGSGAYAWAIAPAGDAGSDLLRRGTVLLREDSADHARQPWDVMRWVDGRTAEAVDLVVCEAEVGTAHPKTSEEEEETIDFVRVSHFEPSPVDPFLRGESTDPQCPRRRARRQGSQPSTIAGETPLGICLVPTCERMESIDSIAVTLSKGVSCSKPFSSAAEPEVVPSAPRKSEARSQRVRAFQDVLRGDPAPVDCGLGQSLLSLNSSQKRPLSAFRSNLPSPFEPAGGCEQAISASLDRSARSLSSLGSWRGNRLSGAYTSGRLSQKQPSLLSVAALRKCGVELASWSKESSSRPFNTTFPCSPPLSISSQNSGSWPDDPLRPAAGMHPAAPRERHRRMSAWSSERQETPQADWSYNVRSSASIEGSLPHSSAGRRRSCAQSVGAPGGTGEALGSGQPDTPENGEVTCRQSIHETLEDPTQSRCGKLIAGLSLVAILASTITLCVETLPRYQAQSRRNEGPWFYLETIFVTFFSLELVVRLWAAPDRIAFVKNVLNALDFVAVLPYYVELIIGSSSDASGLRVLRVVRVARVFRLLKVARYADGLKLIVVVMGQLGDVLILVLFVAMISLLLWSSCLFFIEGVSISTFDAANETWIREDITSLYGEDEYSPFQSIPATFWWCISTITVVGYGDDVPYSPAAKFLASMAMVSGTFIIAIPASVFGSTFLAEYQRKTECRIKAKHQANKQRTDAIVAVLHHLSTASLFGSDEDPHVDYDALMWRMLWDDAYAGKAVRLWEQRGRGGERCFAGFAKELATAVRWKKRAEPRCHYSVGPPGVENLLWSSARHASVGGQSGASDEMPQPNSDGTAHSFRQARQASFRALFLDRSRSSDPLCRSGSMAKSVTSRMSFRHSASHPPAFFPGGSDAVIDRLLRLPPSQTRLASFGVSSACTPSAELKPAEEIKLSPPPEVILIPATSCGES